MELVEVRGSLEQIQEQIYNLKLLQLEYTNSLIDSIELLGQVTNDLVLSLFDFTFCMPTQNQIGIWQNTWKLINSSGPAERTGTQESAVRATLKQSSQ